MGNSVEIVELRVALESVGGPVGLVLEKYPEFDRQDSIVVLISGRTSCGKWIHLHHSCAYMFGGHAVMADAVTEELARHEGFHAPGLAIRIVDRWALGNLPGQRILTLPEVGPNWTHKQEPFGFVKVNCVEKASLPVGIQSLGVTVFCLSPRGLQFHQRVASKALLQGKIAFRRRWIPLSNDTFLDRLGGVRAALSGKSIQLDPAGSASTEERLKFPALKLIKPAS